MPQVQKIETERLTLRALQDADAPLISLYIGDWRVAKYLDRAPHPYPDGASMAYIETARAEDYSNFNWVIAKDDQLIGVISMENAGDGLGNIGYWLAPQLWGGGYMPEALAAVVEFARGDGFKRLEASVHQGNEASAKVLLKNGFEYVHDTDCTSVSRGATVPAWHYALEFTDA